MRAAIVQLASLIGVTVLVSARDWRAAAVDVAIVDKNNSRARRKDPMKTAKKVAKPCFRHMRPPESRQAAGEFPWECGQIVSILFAEGGLAVVNGLGTGNCQDLFVDVRGNNRRRRARQDLCPIAGAAGELENISLGKSPFDHGTQPPQISLTFRL